MLFDENVGLFNELLTIFGGSKDPVAYKYHVFQDPCYHPECVEIYTMVYHDPVIRSFEHFKRLL